MPTLEAERMKGSALAERDAKWLRLSNQGWTAFELAAFSDCTPAFVEKRLPLVRLAARKAEAARRGPLPPELEVVVAGLVPLFPMGGTPFKPDAKECPHKGPIREGSAFCCMVCHQSGRDKEIEARVAAQVRKAASAA